MTQGNENDFFGQLRAIGYVILGVITIAMVTTGGITAFDMFLTNQPKNNIGDFMAGWFAPLAFAWFAFTAVMQHFELSLMRKEYKETRGVLQDQEKAQTKQAKLQEKTAKALEKQASITIVNQTVEALQLVNGKRSLNSNLGKYFDDNLLPALRNIEKRTEPIEYEINSYSIRNLLVLFRKTVRTEIYHDDDFSILSLKKDKLVSSFGREFLILDTLFQNDIEEHPLIKLGMLNTDWKFIRMFYECVRFVEEIEQEIL